MYHTISRNPTGKTPLLKDLIHDTFGYFEGYINTATDIRLAVALVDVFKSLLHSEKFPELSAKLSDVAGNFLRKKWKDTKPKVKTLKSNVN